MPHSVFVSYSQPDQDRALELVAHLEAAGINVWIAPRDISPAADWAAEIIDAISTARIMVLIFSAHSNVSPQVRREVERAVHKQVPVLPFRIEDVLPSRSLEYFLSAQHWLDAFNGPREPHYARLCAHLATLLGSSATAPDRADPTATVEVRTAGITQPAFSRSLSATELQALELQLARHVGPVARLLVRRALPKAADWNQLTQQLAGELESEPGRRQFIEACRALSASANANASSGDASCASTDSMCRPAS